MHGHIIIISW